jgi:hypothetical protein
MHHKENKMIDVNMSTDVTPIKRRWIGLAVDFQTETDYTMVVSFGLWYTLSFQIGLGIR